MNVNGTDSGRDQPMAEARPPLDFSPSATWSVTINRDNGDLESKPPVNVSGAYAKTPEDIVNERKIHETVKAAQAFGAEYFRLNPMPARPKGGAVKSDITDSPKFLPKPKRAISKKEKKVAHRSLAAAFKKCAEEDLRQVPLPDKVTLPSFDE